MIAMPMPFAMRRVMQGVVRRGREARQEVGVTSGDGSDSHAHLAMDSINGFSMMADMMVALRCWV